MITFAKSRVKGFTLIELLTVTGIIAIMASLLVVGLFNVKRKAREIHCISNMRQLGLAFALYLADHNETFPASGPGLLPEEWIYFSPRSPGALSASPVLQYLPGSPTNLLRCPADALWKLLDTRSYNVQLTAWGGSEIFPFSYTFNDATKLEIFWAPTTGQKFTNDPTPLAYRGMASAYTTDLKAHFKLDMVRRPSEKIMLADELGPSRTGLILIGQREVKIEPFLWAQNNSSWQPHEPLSLNHGKRGLTQLADGHVERFDNLEAALPAHANALFGQ